MTRAFKQHRLYQVDHDTVTDRGTVAGQSDYGAVCGAP